MEQDTIEATIRKTDVILMVFVEGVHEVLQRGQIPGAYPLDASLFYGCPASCGANFSGPPGYGLALQMRRAAVSTPANIAEGFRRRGKADKARYMNMAEASLEESRYYLILAQDLGYGDTSNLTSSLEEVSRLLNAYVSAIRASDS
jgi:four helix bundle protein